MSEGESKRSVARPILIGCGVVVLLLVLCGGGVAFFGARGWNAFQAELQRSAEDEEFARAWAAPPEDAPESTFAPDSVAGFELASADGNAAFPALGIERAGRRAVYERGDETVEVSVYRANDAETAAIFDEVVRRIDDDDRFRSHSHVRLPRSLRFSVSDPVDLNGVLWHGGDWLVFVRSTTVADLRPFLRDYLAAVGAETATVERGVPQEPEGIDPGSEAE